MAGVNKVHTSAHPKLPAAKAEQVVQYLLARNYHLTALELLIESQSAGHDSEFPELELYFSNTDRFPPEEVAKHAPADALDTQALAKEREQKLQVLEYELRVAKEDLSAMKAKVAAAVAQSSNPTSPTSTALRGSFTTSRLSDSLKHGLRQSMSVGHDDLPVGTKLDNTNGLKLTESGEGIDEGLQSQLPVPGQFPNVPQDVEGLDYSVLGQPTMIDHEALLGAVVAYCLQLGLRTSAITLQEEASDALPGSSLGMTTPGRGAGVDGLTLWRWFRVAKQALVQQGAAALHDQAAADTQKSDQLKALQAQVQELQASLARAEAEVSTAKAAAQAAAAQVAVLKKQLDDAHAAKAAADAQATPALGLLAAGSIDLRGSFSAHGNGRNAAAAGLLDAQDIATCLSIVGQLTELLPRIMPALTIKTRLEILPMVQAVILASHDAETQRALTGLVFNGVATPDPAQRGAVVALCAGVASKLGPTWAAQELLANCCKQVTSPSAERRVLVAEMITALLAPAAVQPLTASGPGDNVLSGYGLGHAPLIDCTAQASVLLPALHRLAEDRMEQVREAAVVALVALLRPGCLPFTKAHYASLEEILLLLVCDSESVSCAAMDSLAPALVAWTSFGDLVSTSLIPRVVIEISRLSRDAAALLGTSVAGTPSASPSGSMSHSLAGSGGSVTQLTVPGHTGGGARGGPAVGSRVLLGNCPPGAFNSRKYACWEHQAMYQLLDLYSFLLPTLKSSALQSVPTWLAATVTGVTAEDAVDKHTDPTDNTNAAGTKENRQSDSSASGQTQSSPFSNTDKSENGSAAHSAVEHKLETGETAESNEQGALPRGSSDDSMNTTIIHNEVDGSGSIDESQRGSKLPDALQVIAQALVREQPYVDVRELVANGLVDQAALFAAWAASDKCSQWKRMQWILQFLLPELVDLARNLGVPPQDPTLNPSPGNSQNPEQGNRQLHHTDSNSAGGSNAHGVTASCWLMHGQVAKTVALTAITFGSAWSRATLLPVYCTASSCPVPALYNSKTSQTVQEAVEQLVPQTAASVQTARTCVLPHFLAAALPYSHSTAISEWIQALTQLAHEVPPSLQQTPPFFGLLQLVGGLQHPQWMQASKQHLAAAVTFACSLNPPVTGKVLHVLESLVQKQSGSGAQQAPSSAPNTASNPRLSGLQGAVALSVAHGLLPLMSSNLSGSTTSLTGDMAHDHRFSFMPPLPETVSAAAETPAQAQAARLDVDEEQEATTQGSSVAPAIGLSRKVMSLLMVMLSEGDMEVQAGVVGVLLDVLLRYSGGSRADTKLVDQVCVVYDGLLASNNHHLNHSVLSAAQHLASVTAANASKIPSAGQLLDWVLQAVLSMLPQLNPPNQAPGTPATIPYPTDQQRQLAVKLLGITHAVFMHDVRLPGIGSTLQTCIEGLAKHRAILPDLYSAVLTPMLANNRQAAGAAMASATATAAAMSAIAAPPSAAGSWTSPAPLLVAPTGKVANTPMHPSHTSFTQPGQQYTLSPQQQQYLQLQQQQHQQQAPHKPNMQPQLLHQGSMQGHGQQQHGMGLTSFSSGPQQHQHQQQQRQQPPQEDTLGARFEKLKNRFRKKSVADGEIE